MRTMKHWAIAAMTATALALAGCGGGGSSSSAPPAGPTMAELQMEQRTAISTAIMAAETAVAGVNDDSTDGEVSAAEMAVADARTAIAAAADVPAAETASDTRAVNVIANRLTAAKTSRTAAIDEADKAANMAMAATGKALHAALADDDTGTTPLTNIDPTATALAASGLTIDATAGAGALDADDNPASVELKAGDSAGALGSWNGMDYALSMGTGDDMVTNEARVYTNRGAPTTRPFAEVHTGIANGVLPASAVTTGIALVMADAFTHSGTQTHAVPDRSDGVYVRGTFDGAPGVFFCATSCSSTNNGSGSPSGLAGEWTFTPDTGAMVSQPDANYLYYGWWVSKDSKGSPTAASAFAEVVGDVDGTGDTTAGSALTGSATYAGHAAGKFAMSNPLDGTGNGGHFTADAELKATFGTDATAGMTGTIDNFRLNDGSEDPGWSVSLARGAWGSTGAITAPAADPTVWSINGNKAPASGTWSGQMYDEMPGATDATPPGDGSNIPTTVTGTFYSEFSTIGRMVGAFGAEKTE